MGRGWRPGNPEDWRPPARGKAWLMYTALGAAGLAATLIMVLNWHPAKVLITGLGPPRPGSLPQRWMKGAAPARPRASGVAAAELSIHESPSLKSPKLGSLAKGEQYQVIGQGKVSASARGWLFVQSPAGVVGWVYPPGS